MSWVVSVMVTRLLPKGCTVKASPYVTLPLPSPAVLEAKVKPGARTPPPFINAMTAPPKLGGWVAVSCESAIRLPASMLQAPSTRELGRSVVIEPSTWLAMGDTSAL